MTTTWQDIEPKVRTWRGGVNRFLKDVLLGIARPMTADALVEWSKEA